MPNVQKQAAALGMSRGTANHRLLKQIVLKMLQGLNQHWCFQCGGEIKSVSEMSVEHKVPWDGKPDLFWDLDNVAFSHRDCNSAAGLEYRWRVKPIGDGTTLEK